MLTTPPTIQQITLPPYAGDAVTFEEPNDHLFAVLIGGLSDSFVWAEISFVYNTLLEKGYKKENIFVHFGINLKTNQPFN